MPSLTPAEIGTLLQPFLDTPSATLLDQLSLYLDLLLKWNARTNLTAIRTPQEIVTRHFGESLFAATILGNPGTLLDYGSGAGFPGLPIALYRPDIQVTLAESQNKKVSFLREAVRTLNIAVTIWPSRVEEMPPERLFDTVTMRAVDAMLPAIHGARIRATRDLLILTSDAGASEIPALDGFHVAESIRMPASEDRIVLRLSRV